MRPLLLLLAAMTCLATSVYAQEAQDEEDKPTYLNLNADDNPFLAGLILGANTGTLSNDGFPGFHNLGYTAGATVYVRLAPLTWINMELLYHKKGAIGVRTSESPYWGTYFEKYYLKMNYAELPVLFHFFNPKKPWYHFSAGVSYSRLINSSERLDTSPIPINIDQELFYFNKNSFDYVVGGGLHVNRKLYLNVRYQANINKVRDAFRVHPQAGAGDQYLTTCSLQLMYLFRAQQ